MDQKLTLILPILLVILVSGCTGQPTVTGNGVVIDSFITDFPQVFSGEPTRFYVKIKNTGSSDAEDITVIMVGLDEWGGGTQECDIERLIAPNPTYGTLGGEKICTFTYNAPPVSQSIPYQATTRLTYFYRSTVVKTVVIASQGELRRIQDLGTALPSETKEQSSSPIQLDVQVQGPIRYWEGQGQVEFPVTININNVGGGVVCSPDCDDSNNWYRVAIDPDAGTIKTDCDYTFITLYKGQSNTITCTATVGVGDIIGPAQKTIQVESEYDYMIDESITVTVSPTYSS